MSLVLTSIADGVATLTLNNPDERNTLTAPMVAGIIEAMDRIESDPAVGALVVTGTAPAFCAGANLGNLAEATKESLGTIYEGFLRVARSPLPTIAAVNGAASCGCTAWTCSCWSGGREESHCSIYTSQGFGAFI